MKFQLPELPYEKDALAPAISAETLTLHYDKHHRGYIDQTNKLLSGSGFENASLEEIVKKADGKLFNQAAQAWNHEFYWLGLAPPEECHPIDQWPELKAAIDENFGSSADFIEKFDTAAAELFGSGWTWLVKDPNTSKLSILALSNAENPLKKGLIPLWVIDVWEHAYYVDYRNERKKYLDNIWTIANWKFVQERLDSNQAFELTGLMRAPSKAKADTKKASG